MRVAAAFLLIILLLCVVASCVFTSLGAESEQSEQSVEGCTVVADSWYSDSIQTIEARVGEEFTIALDANPSTGYTWQADFDQGLVRLKASEFRQAAAKPGMVGVGGEQRFTFVALKAGSARITFVYKRPWEEGVAQRKVFTVHIGE